MDMHIKLRNSVSHQRPIHAEQVVKISKIYVATAWWTRTQQVLLKLLLGLSPLRLRITAGIRPGTCSSLPSSVALAGDFPTKSREIDIENSALTSIR